MAVPHILILGGSGELGGAIARCYARNGASLSLWGRDLAKLARISTECDALGASEVSVRSLDIMDVEAALAAAQEEDDARPFDVAILASGSGDICGPDTIVEDPTQILRLVQVNFAAPAAIAARLGQRMAQRSSGILVLVGSSAGFHSLPFAAGYAGSKAGLARLGDALRIALRPHGVSVTLISPGFIDTAAARRVPGPKPFIMSPDRAARMIVARAGRRRAHLVMPWAFAFLRLMDRALPRILRDRLLRALAPPTI